MSFKLKFKNIMSSFEDLFLKNHACLSCRREICDGTKFSLCENCFNKLEFINGKVCACCGEAISDSVMVCGNCDGADYNFKSNKSLVYYDDVSANIVKRLKYLSRRYCAKYIAELMCQNKHIFENVDVITFVPIGERRLKERGFNQAFEIAKEISNITGIEVVELLKKVGNEKHQAGLSRKERMENLKDSFVIIDENVKHIKNKNILIIDDVFTTGATLSECARVLNSKKSTKPSIVNAYTFAKTKLFSTRKG